MWVNEMTRQGSASGCFKEVYPAVMVSGKQGSMCVRGK